MRKRGTVSTLRLLAATAFAPSLALAQGGAPPIRSIDIYGSSVLDSAAVRAEFEPDLVRFIELGWQAGFGRDSAPANAPELEAEMEATRAKIRTALESRARISTTPADPAYEILKRVSGEAFGERDYAAWERWAASR